jgi:hypothetical protein
MTTAKQLTISEAVTKYGIKFSCTRIASRPDGGGNWDTAARHYRCRIGHGRRSFGLYFSQGSAHVVDPTAKDVLSCLVADAQDYENASSFEDWADEYGYDTDSRKAERIYRGVKRQAEQLKRTVGDTIYNILLECSEE